jgi:hypothetical protein
MTPKISGTVSTKFTHVSDNLALVVGTGKAGKIVADRMRVECGGQVIAFGMDGKVIYSHKNWRETDYQDAFDTIYRALNGQAPRASEY